MFKSLERSKFRGWLAACARDSSTAHIPSSEIGRGYFQETHRPNLFRDVARQHDDGDAVLRHRDADPRFSVRVEDPADLRAAMQDAVAYDGPALIDAVIARQELAMPPRTELARAEGFSLWVMKAVLNGRASEVVDLARTNLWR
jgi:hypothetical protein